MKRHKITKVDEGGIAEELGIEEGDFLLAINDKEIEDIFDYDFIVNDEYLEVLIEKANGEEWLLEVEKDYDEDLGMEFGESLMDEYRSCFNKCVFCFIDQNPPGMRETIYFKDDDTRLSFLQGNYVTLTNMKEKDIQTPSWRHRDNILTPEAAAELAERFRREKKVVGFTNGCFDLLHLGHLHSFMKAREACDVLFVGLNTDASIKRLKGEDRPINNEEMRSLLLASLDFVDYVVPFDEDTALPLIEKLRPDVIAKEGYPLEFWPEGQFVKSYGGQALELPRLEGFSSTNIINRMKSSPE